MSGERIVGLRTVIGRRELSKVDGGRRELAAEPEAARQELIRVSAVTHLFGSLENTRFTAVEDITFKVAEGQFVAIVGPSGCGKTTVLNMIAGLIRPTRGLVTIRDREVTGPSRSIGYMFARDALIPWRTAQKNVEFGLEIRGVSKHRRQQISTQLLITVGLANFGRSFPSQLSQGMRQRVALARTLAVDPEIFLLDEPFAALDAQTKLNLEAEFANLWERTGKTVVLVTHDLEEAVSMADRIIVFDTRPGRILLDERVNLPRPRDVQAIRYTPEFQVIARDVWKLLRQV